MSLQKNTTPERIAERTEVSAWYGWSYEHPEDGSVLVILDATASEREALFAVCEVLEIDLSQSRPEERVAARKGWESGASSVTLFHDGADPEIRQRTRVENDLLEEIAALWTRVPEE